MILANLPVGLLFLLQDHHDIRNNSNISNAIEDLLSMKNVYDQEKETAAKGLIEMQTQIKNTLKNSSDTAYSMDDIRYFEIVERLTQMESLAETSNTNQKIIIIFLIIVTCSISVLAILNYRFRKKNK